MTDPKTTLRYPEVMAEEGLDDWRFFLVRLHARFKTGSFVKGLELVTRITEAAEEANHHPDVVLTYPQVDVDLISHDVGGVTSRDLDLARRISAIAAELGVEAAPRDVSTLELALDVPDADEVKPFWAAVLATSLRDKWPEIYDGGGRNNTLWFQNGPRRDRRRPAAVPPRHRRAARGRRGAGPGSDRRRRHPGQHRRRAGVLGAGRRARQQGLRLHRRRARADPLVPCQRDPHTNSAAQARTWRRRRRCEDAQSAGAPAPTHARTWTTALASGSH